MAQEYSLLFQLSRIVYGVPRIRIGLLHPRAKIGMEGIAKKRSATEMNSPRTSREFPRGIYLLIIGLD